MHLLYLKVGLNSVWVPCFVNLSASFPYRLTWDGVHCITILFILIDLYSILISCILSVDDLLLWLNIYSVTTLKSDKTAIFIVFKYISTSNITLKDEEKKKRNNNQDYWHHWFCVSKIVMQFIILKHNEFYILIWGL